MADTAKPGDHPQQRADRPYRLAVLSSTLYFGLFFGQTAFAATSAGDTDATDDLVPVSVTERAQSRMGAGQETETLTTGFAAPRVLDTEKLDLEDVLESTAEHFPQLLAARANVRESEGEALSALGAFDLNVGGEFHSNLTGFYGGTSFGSEFSQFLGDYNARVFGSYRMSRGDFPVYEDIRFTNQGGEAKIGVILSLLQDRDIDERRFALLGGRLGIERSRGLVLQTQLGVHRDAMIAYMRWLAEGEKLTIFEDLLSLAEIRQKALETRAASGDVAEITVTENNQLILQRQNFVVNARRAYEVAAQGLSFFLRDRDGQPLIPSDIHLQTDFPALPPIADAQMAVALDRALQRRPELKILDVDVRETRANLQLSENKILPRLDVKLESSHDFGGTGTGGESRDSTDNVVTVNLSVPLQRRDARGRVTAAEARLTSLSHQRRLIADGIDIEVRNLATTLEAARRAVTLAFQEVDLADALEKAEKRRFEQGDSDFFLINLRERNSADAKVRLVDAELNYFGALAAFYAATVDMAALQIPEG